MNRTTAVFLICLRLAIGWHFLVEGWHKVHSQLVGPAETNRVFSSEGYFREAQGPLGRVLRSQLGDPDDELLARLTLEPLPKNADESKSPPLSRVPPALARDWDDYLVRFNRHYHLDASQKKLAESKLAQSEATVVDWLTRGKAQVKKTFPTGDVERVEPVPERIAEYRALVQEVRDTYDRKLPLFGKDVEKAKLVKAKADLAQLRSALAANLREQTDKMKKQLRDVLTAAQKQQSEPAEAAEAGSPTLSYLNQATAWGLFAIGAGLLVGLFSRFWCTLGAAFLFLTYLAVPPLPWLPTPPQQEGTYLFVNKNLVEMLALLALATTRSGRWFGLDGLVHTTCTAFRRKHTDTVRHKKLA